ncbi:cytochrome c oxidase subunit 3 [Rubrivirga sp.]|uniref:cytochrome c oxidase subunit 3 n=1 Tax=Rubrivirga sp. TaxID=1885344 RepID=UPI003B518C68
MATTPTPQVTVDDPHAGHDHGGDGHGHHEAPMLVGHDGQLHPSRLQHFFVSSEQQFEASKLGMWLFLATEILLFGGMFVAYGIFRVLYPELYEQASLQLDTVLGATNTLVLLLSSLTMAWAIRGAQMDNRKVLIGNLIATMVLAAGFLVVKYFEYGHKFELGIWPGVNFELDEGTQRVGDLTGAVAGTPLFVAPSEAADGAEVTGETSDAEVVEAESGALATADAPLSGTDQAAPPGDATAVPDSPAATGEGPEDGEGAATGEAAAVGADGEGAALDEAVLSEAGRAAAVHDEAGELVSAGLETEHGDDHGEHGREGEIFSNRRAGIFFAIYYVMTGIHAIHIIIGIIAIGFLVFFANRGDYSSVWYTPVENVGLYWHIVDIIWIFVFPLMYLI